MGRCPEGNEIEHTCLEVSDGDKQAMEICLITFQILSRQLHYNYTCKAGQSGSCCAVRFKPASFILYFPDDVTD